MKVYVVTGTPGCGKTVLARKIARIIKGKYVDVNKVIKEYNLEEGYDKARKTKIVDVNKLIRALKKEIRNLKSDVVIDSHLSHYLDKKMVSTCFVVKCELKKLKTRLKKRKYSKEKIRENIDSEIFDVCMMEALAFGHKIRVVDTSKNLKDFKM